VTKTEHSQYRLSITKTITLNTEKPPMKAYCIQNTGDCRTCSLSSYGRDCRNNRIEEPTGAKLTEDTFRTCWHGARFGEDDMIERMRARGGDMAAGVVDGLVGIAPRGMRGE